MRRVPRPVIEQFIGTLRFRDEKRCPGRGGMARSLWLLQTIRNDSDEIYLASFLDRFEED